MPSLRVLVSSPRIAPSVGIHVRDSGSAMLGFTVPLILFGIIEASVALWLLLPIPFARPAIWVCKQSNSQVGRTVMATVSVILVILTLAPLYDLIHLHKMKYESKGSDVSSPEARESEATSNLSGILTVSCLVSMFLTRRLGLALADIDSRGGWTQASKGPASSVKAE